MLFVYDMQCVNVLKLKKNAMKIVQEFCGQCGGFLRDYVTVFQFANLWLEIKTINNCGLTVD
jgi:hypothetical protein